MANKRGMWTLLLALVIGGCAATPRFQAPSDRPAWCPERAYWPYALQRITHGYDDPILMDVPNVEQFVANFNKFSQPTYIKVPDRVTMFDTRAGGLVKLYFITDDCMITESVLPRKIVHYLIGPQT